MIQYKFIFFLVTTWGFSLHLVGQDHDWTDYHKRESKYPSHIYFKGISYLQFDKTDDLNLLITQVRQQAQAQLSENIKVSIEVEILNQMSNVNTISHDEFKRVTKSYSSIEISGLNTDYYLNDKKKEILGFAWIRKSQVHDHYSKKIESILARLHEIDELSHEMLNTNQAKALEMLHASNLLFRQIQEGLTIMELCGAKDSITQINEDILNLRSNQLTRLEKLENIKHQSIKQLSKYLTESIKIQTSILDKPIYVSNIVYRDSEMVSEFSNRFTSAMITELVKSGFHVVESDVMEVSDSTGYELQGAYWESPEEIQVSLSLFRSNPKGQEIIAGVEGWMKMSEVVDARLEYKPANYFEALQKAVVLSKQDQGHNSGTKLELWTSKGDNGLVYKEGESVRISLRMNRQGYIRLVNFWADGTEVLLLDNYHIDYKKVNRIIQLPLEWQVSCPCGIEFIHASAQDQEYVPVNTINEDGFNIIQGSLVKLIEDRRISNTTNDSGLNFYVEKELLISTLD